MPLAIIIVGVLFWVTAATLAAVLSLFRAVVHVFSRHGAGLPNPPRPGLKA